MRNIFESLARAGTVTAVLFAVVGVLTKAGMEIQEYFGEASLIVFLASCLFLGIWYAMYEYTKEKNS